MANPSDWHGMGFMPLQAQAEALAYIKDWTAEEREYLRVTVSECSLQPMELLMDVNNF
jgi:hypothetical protein